MKTSLERIKNDIEKLSQFNNTPENGLTRFSLTKEEQSARAYIREQLESIGITTYEDNAGSIFGRYEGEENLPCIMIGSHFDSVKNGGHFDGPAGISMGLEVLRTMAEEGIKLKHTIEFVGMIEEEGGRFGSGVFGSRAMVDGVTYEMLLKAVDNDGISMAKAFEMVGIDPKKIWNAKRKKGDIKAFIELHIEQGPTLENEELDVGIVDFIVGILEFKININGRPDHAGTTPMNMRKDALIAASALVLELEKYALECEDGTVATVGALNVKPGAANIIPSSIELTVDIRSKNQKSIDFVKYKIQKQLQKLEDKRGVQYTITPLIEVHPVAMNQLIQDRLIQQSKMLNIKYKSMLSGAGHDAMIMAGITNVGLVFVPSKDGRSHSKEEWTDYEQLQKGIELIYHTILEIGECL